MSEKMIARLRVLKEELEAMQKELDAAGMTEVADELDEVYRPMRKARSLLRGDKAILTYAK